GQSRDPGLAAVRPRAAPGPLFCIQLPEPPQDGREPPFLAAQPLDAGLLQRLRGGGVPDRVEGFLLDPLELEEEIVLRHRFFHSRRGAHAPLRERRSRSLFRPATSTRSPGPKTKSGGGETRT